VLKQMRLIYAQGFSKSEKEEWRAIIFNNILSAFKVILDAMEELGLEFDIKSNNVSHIILVLWLSFKAFPSMTGLIAPLYL
jgi:guanine nucleotide-binding protein subunit alpha, other